MPVAKVQLEDGRIARFDVPEGTSPDDVLKAAQGLPKPEAAASEKPHGWIMSGIAGFLKGIDDPGAAADQLVWRGVEGLAPSGSSFEAWAKKQRKNIEDSNKDIEGYYQKNFRGDDKGVDWGRMAGNVSTAIPMTMWAPATIPGAMAAGAMTGALQPVDVPEDDSFWGEKAKQVALGAAVSGGSAAALRGVSRIISPKSTPEVKQLVEAGVVPTPGQTLGGVAQRLEEGATSIPVLGDVVKSAQRRSMESFNQAAINKALAPIGEKLESNVGREGISEAADKISNAYDTLLPKMTVHADNAFQGEINNLLSLGQNLPDGGQQLLSLLKTHLGSKFNPQTMTMTGEALKTSESELGRLARTYSNSQVGGERELGLALKEAQAILRRAVERANPQFSDELRAINQAYATKLRVEGAASRLGQAEPGVFSPAQLLSSVRQLDPTMRKSAFAKGDALLQEFAEAGKKVLGSKVPDSGTPFRLAASAGIPLAAYMADPVTGAAVGSAMAAYTPLGQKMMLAALLQRPKGAETVADIVRSLATVSPATVPLAQQLAD